MFVYQFVVVIVEFQVVLFQILEKSLRSQDLAYFDKLVSIAVSHEKGLFLENHRGEHGSS